ncbi:MAG: vWA domain-containing protein, partial [Candidatus Edwardsbacteria bacterium]
MQAVYPLGQEAAKYGDYIWVTAQTIPFNPDTIFCVDSLFGSPPLVWMYDDGSHKDGVAGDGIFGTDSILVVDSLTMAAYRGIRVFAKFGGAGWQNCPGSVGIKNRKPFLTPLGTVYPVGQSAAKDSDFVTISSWVSDLAGKIDLLEVIDISGSMAGAPLDSSKKAAKKIVDGLDSTDRAGLWSFSNDVYMDVWRPLSGVSGHQTVKNAIDALVAGGATALYDATFMGSESLRVFSRDIPVMVLLSDGSNTTTPYAHTRIECYFRPIPIFTIAYYNPAFGDPDTAFLDSVARTSAGGKYYFSPTGAALDSIATDIINVLANMNAPYGIKEAWVDATPIGGPNRVLLYDDGGHNDGAAGDTIWGSGPIMVDTTVTDTSRILVYASDIALNQRQDTTTTRLDNIIPRVDSLVTRYPAGRRAVRNGEKVLFTVVARDTGRVSGIRKVILDATQIGGPPEGLFYDDGAHNDGAVNDGVFGSDSFTVNTGTSYSGIADVYATGYDVAQNKKKRAGGVVVDNIPPQIQNIQVAYPSGQPAAKAGDVVKISALITDDLAGVNDTTAILNSVNLDGTSHRLYDNGTNGDEVAGDRVYTYAIVITSVVTGTTTFTIAAADSATNTAAPLSGEVTLDNTPPGPLVVTVLDLNNIYHNGETIRLRATTDAAGYRVTADFSPIDNYYINGAETVQ